MKATLSTPQKNRKSAKITTPLRLIVIGNGMVGFRFLEQLTKQKTALKYAIKVFGDEPNSAYDRVHLTNLFGGKTAEQLQFASNTWYTERQIELRTGDPVVRLDVEEKTVRTRSGILAHFDRLVIATGSRPFIPPIPGNNSPSVFVYRTIEDVQAIQEAASKAERAAVIGGGLLGLEAADALKKLGLETHIVERNIGLMSQQLPPEGSHILQREILQKGFQFHLNKNTKAIRYEGEETTLEFQNGEALIVNMVVIASGIRPCDGIAKEAGLKLHNRGGIVVDNHLQTSVEHIYAIGECANHHGIVYGLVSPGYKMADILAEQLAGRRGRFRGDFLSARLKLLGVDVVTFGDHQGEGQYLQKIDRKSFRRIVIRNNRLVGATIVGPCDETNRLQEAIDRNRYIWQWNRTRFTKTGQLWSAKKEAQVATWPKNALVCNCLNIRRGTLSDAVSKKGCRTIETLSSLTGAATVCGSCRPLLASLIGAPSVASPTKGYIGLLIASVLSILLGLLITLLPPIAPGASVTTSSLETLWTNSFWKFATGYTLTGLCAVSLVLSLRKRVRRIQAGNFGYWRAAHSLIGVSTLVVLITHTGLRLGENLNFILMTNFLGLAIVGALAGLMTSLETKLSTPMARRVRSFGTVIHTVLFWPLPILIFFHAFKAYYY